MRALALVLYSSIHTQKSNKDSLQLKLQSLHLKHFFNFQWKVFLLRLRCRDQGFSTCTWLGLMNIRSLCLDSMCMDGIRPGGHVSKDHLHLVSLTGMNHGACAKGKMVSSDRRLNWEVKKKVPNKTTSKIPPVEIGTTTFNILFLCFSFSYPWCRGVPCQRLAELPC